MKSRVDCFTRLELAWYYRKTQILRHWNASMS